MANIMEFDSREALREEIKKLRALLSFATEFDLEKGQISYRDTDQITGERYFVIINYRNVLNKEGKWEYEPMPSSRTGEFIKRTRRTLQECLDALEFI